MKVPKIAWLFLVFTACMYAVVIVILWCDSTVAMWRRIGGALFLALLYVGVWWLAARILKGQAK